MGLLLAMLLSTFASVWALDFEYTATGGERPVPICVVAHDLISGRRVSQWLQPPGQPPFTVNDSSLFVAYMATAELSCFHALGWLVPLHWLDLYVEFRNLTNGIVPPGRRGLLNALEYYHITGINSDEKSEMRALAIRGAPFTPEEEQALLAYCATDVDALVALYPNIVAELDAVSIKRCPPAPSLDLSRAINLRGAYMVATAAMEHVGVPIDMHRLGVLRERWQDVQRYLMMLSNYRYENVYQEGRFDSRRFDRYLRRHRIDWPRLDSGALALDDDTFRMMVRIRPELVRLRDTRQALSQLRLTDLQVGSDGRNRTMLSPFASRTGRSQPSNAKFIFGPSIWLRGLIQPEPGQAIAYVDWASAEFGIAAALSGDANMMAAYVSGDPYLHFARLARETPEAAKAKRSLYKTTALGVLYGMGANALGVGIEGTPVQARWLMDVHRRVFAQYWRWSDAVATVAAIDGQLETELGWMLHLPADLSETSGEQRMRAAKSDRTARNFPVQATGAELLRLAVMTAQADGVRVVAPVHDAVLIEARDDKIETTIKTMQRAMADASRVLLHGFELRSECDQLIRHPDRYMDEKRGRETWDMVWKLLGKVP
jgi:DNA polymerase-1